MKRLLFLGGAALALIGFGFTIPSDRATVGETVTTRQSPTQPARRSRSRLEQGIVAIGAHAWAGTFPAALSRVTDFAVFHAPEPGPDETARQAYEAGDPSSDTFVYQNFGFSCEIETWTTCGFSTGKARSRGLLARYNGREVVLDGVRRAIDAGKPGYGQAVAQAFASRLAVLSPRPDGVFIDDVNVVDSRLPRNGVPDGYTVETYRAALEAQFSAAIDELERLGYQTMANLGGISAGELALAGVADFTFLEFCGTVAARRIEAAIRVTRSRGGRFVCQSFGATQAHGADAVAFAGDSDYRAPFHLSPPR